MKTTLDIALIRWSVTHCAWRDLANDCPHMGAFLAGWFCRDMGLPIPAEIPVCRDSFRKGWAECDVQLAIMAREEALQPDPQE